MANVIKFDPNEVLSNAQSVFWQKGFLGTTTRELQKATGLKPGSLYSSFGNKSELYKSVLQTYVKSLVNSLRTEVENAPSTLEGLKQFLMQCLSETAIKQNNELCLIVKTLSELQYQTEEDGHNPYQDIIDFASLQLKIIESEFEFYFEQAAKNGELSGTPAQLAKKLQLQFIGLRQYACITKETKFIEHQIAELIESFKSD